MNEKREKCDECETTYDAAYYGDKECLEICVAYNCPLHQETTRVAASRGHKSILEYCVMNNFPWHPETTYYAAQYGHKECLEICVKNNCTWDPVTTLSAAMNGDKEILEYIFENCKDFVSWEESKLEEHMDEYSKEIQEYVLSVKDEWQWYSKRCQDIKG